MLLANPRVTLPEVPPPVNLLPATTAVMSPCGIFGKDCKSPAPSIYSSESPFEVIDIEAAVVELTTEAV